MYKGILPKLGTGESCDGYHSSGNCKMSWRVRPWAVSQNESPALTGTMKGLFLSGLACSLPFKTQREEQRFYPMVTVLCLSLSSFNYRDHAFWMRYWNTWLDAWPNNGMKNLKWGQLYIRTLEAQWTDSFYLVPFTYNPNKARFALCSISVHSCIKF